MAGATRDSMGNLHEIVAQSLIEQIQAWREGRLVEEKDGVYVKVFPPALLAVAVKFLKDNGIEAVATPGSKVAGLAEKLRLLPFPTSSTGTDG